MSSEQYVNHFIKLMGGSWKLGKNIGARRLRNEMTRRGYDPMTIEAAVEQFKANKPIDGIIAQAHAHHEKLAEQQALLESPPDYKGSARWATCKELEDSRVCFSDGVSALPEDLCLLGTYDDDRPLDPTPTPSLGLNGAGHLMTIAPPRSGKSVTQIIGTLLHYRGSTVVLDPKGELFEHTSAWRAEHVGPVYVLNPFGYEPLSDFTHAFNPFDGLRIDTDSDALAAILHPEDPNAKESFFADEAQSFLAAAIETMRLFFPEKERTLATLRDLTGSYHDEFKQFIALMSDPDAPAYVRNRAGVVSDYDIRARNRLLSSMNGTMKIWDGAGLRRCTSRSDFDFRDLKDRPATVYLILPLGELKYYSYFVKMLFATALDAMERNATQPAIPVLFILDEFLRLDPFPKFTDALHTHAGLGANFWFFLQDIPKLKEVYPHAWESFFSGTAARMFFGCEDLPTCEVIAKTLDQKTIAYLAANSGQGGGSSSSYSLNESIVYEGRDLMRPNEVKRRLSRCHDSGTRYGLMTVNRVEDPIKTVQRPWWTDPVLKSRVGTLTREELEQTL